MCFVPFSAALLQILLSLVLTDPGYASKCVNRAPNGTQEKVPGDNGFHLEISGGVSTYEASTTYSIKLTSRLDSDRDTRKKFSNFILICENADFRFQSNPSSAGNFQLLGDVLTRYSDHCTNTITETSSIPKSEIQVLWTAPPPGQGCINFKAMVVENSSVWAMDNGGLTLTVCEQTEEEPTNVILDDCCACSEAKYEIMFEGLWSKETHPKDYPTSEWLLHFSDVIGASHSTDYRVWEADGLASKGISQVAKWGSPRVLESELKAKSSQIRTIIKSRGLWYPNVNGKTFSIFRTDSTHHLVSLVSMLGPSPDWIVGVSALEMCQLNCTWIENKELYLFPWDAGVDSGMSYESPDSPTVPQEPIRRITTIQPNNPAAPFYKKGGGPMQPLAKLTIQKLREYKKSCSNPTAGSTVQEFDFFASDGELQTPTSAGCEMTAWSAWSGCSVTCGKGISSRRRDYLDIFKARQNGCNHQLQEKEMCASDVAVCNGNTNFYQSAPGDWLPDDMCTTTEWSSWSECSATCGEGFRVRTRRFYNRMGRKQCPHVETVMKKECPGKMSCPAGSREQIDPACAVTDWSLWSPCSVSCGSGIKVRTRLYRVTRDEQLRAGCNLQLMEKGTCTGRKQDCTWTDSDDICGQKMEVGPCRGYFQRWFHDPESKSCKQFTFGGCRGNSNNFLSMDDCQKICGTYQMSSQDGSDDYTDPLSFSTRLLSDKNFMRSLDILAKQRRQKTTEGMNRIFMEIEEQRQAVAELEREQKSMGVFFNKRHQLMQAQKKLMMMEKQVMMKKQMEVFQQKQRMMDKHSSLAQDPHDREFADTPVVALRHRRPAPSSSAAGALQHDAPHPNRATHRPLADMPLPPVDAPSSVASPTSYSYPKATNSSQHAQDCELTSWSPWSVQCSATCGRGFRHRFRTVSKPASVGGQPCSRKLEKKKKCRLPACPRACTVEEWSAWGACSRSCGSDGVQNRYRRALSGVECGPVEEKRVCLLPCCPGDPTC